MRTQTLLLTLIVFIAFILRAWMPSRMSVEHFDEGVYASNFYSGHLDFRYPDRHLYAPPLLPALYEWTLILTGSPHAVMWVNVILGTALVAAVWWLTRLIVGVGLLGEMSALATALLMTFDNFFIQYSRAALTDIPVCLFIVLAVGMGLKAVRAHAAWAVAAAIFTAMAWWTKYNGWLPLAIIGAGIGGWIVFERPGKNLAIPAIVRFGLIVSLSILLWAPCLYALQDFGGYSAVAKNHAGYVVGWSGWGAGLMRHVQIQQHYSKSGFLALASAVVVLQMLCWPLSKTGRGAWGLAPTLIMATFFAGDLIPLGVLAIIGIIHLSGHLKGASSRQSERQSTATLGWWMLLAWVLGLLLTTPLYSPYPRLLAPLKIALLMAAGIGIVATLKSFIGVAPEAFSESTNKGKRTQIGVMLVGFAVGQLAIGSNNPSYQTRTQFQLLAPEILLDIQATNVVKAGSSVKLDAIIYIIAEPGLYYHLASLEEGRFEFITQPGSNLGMLESGKIDPRVPTFLILGPHAKEERSKLEAFKERLTPIKDYDYNPSDLILLEDILPSDLDQNRRLMVQLFLVK